MLRATRRERGFSILAVILVIVAVIVAIGIWALSGQANTDSGSNASTDVLASGIVTDGQALKLGFDTIVINGGNASQIVFTPGDPNPLNVLNPVTGIALPAAPAKAINSDSYPNQVWTYNKNFVIPNLGVSSAQDYVVMLGGIKDAVCKKINKNLHGDETLPVVGYLQNVRAFMGSATASDPNSSVAVDFTTAGAPLNGLSWVSGCIRGADNQDGDNVYFVVVKAN